MIQIYPAENRFVSDHGWLKSYFSFSFAEYFDPGNMHFGPMRVLNDDTVQPGTGFGMHPHKEMEIVSIVLKGQLRHEDSAGHMETLSFGEVQRMSAGTGIIHSEMNPSETEEVNFLQMWFLPETSGLQPSYEQISFDPENMKNRLLPVVSKHPASDQTASIHQDMTIYLSKLEAGKSLTFEQKENRRIFFFVIEGDVLLNGDHVLKRRDSARITDVSSLTAETDKGCFVVLIDLP
ncbi:pirin family protein [Thermoactinomyces sp. FSL K6-2592]|jgi:quercetin 2,3-dioxygenase|uniref:pirin family protein n=1 Tax=Thermoactinomyces TaxID=2023 RepID=UPI0006739DCF|nr:pirin family protein [Thermoactinomyces vulgaris]QBK14109.1 pirin family protein [Thermoactinomyces vulgaris]